MEPMAARRIAKAFNELLNRAEFSLGRTALWSYPRIIFVEPTNDCRLACPLCSTGSGDRSYPRGYMRMEHFERIMAQLGPLARTVHLYNWGEPLLHPDIWAMVGIAKGYGLTAWLSSSLNDLGRGGAEALVESGLDRLSVSIDGVSRETYGMYRKGGDFSLVMENMRAVIEEKRRRRCSSPSVRWQFIPMRHNEHELEAARRAAEEIGAQFRVKELRLDMVGFNEGPLSERAARDDRWLPSDGRYNRYLKSSRAGGACRYLWDRVTVNWDGVIAPCCRVYRRSDCFGSMLEAGFRPIWNGPAYRHARGLFAGRAEGDSTVCDRCVRQGNLD